MMSHYNVNLNVTSAEADILLFLRHNVNLTKQLGKVATEQKMAGFPGGTLITLCIDNRSSNVVGNLWNVPSTLWTNHGMHLILFSFQSTG